MVIPHWRAAYWPYKIFARLFSHPDLKQAFRVLVYYYSEDLLTADVEMTTRNLPLLENRIWDDIGGPKKQSLLAVYGASLGSVVATRVANKIARLRQDVPARLVLNTSGANFPWAVWNGASTQDIRRDLEVQNISFPQLVTAWNQFSPVQNLGTEKIKRYCKSHRRVAIFSIFALMLLPM